MAWVHEEIIRENYAQAAKPCWKKKQKMHAVKLLKVVSRKLEKKKKKIKKKGDEFAVKLLDTILFVLFYVQKRFIFNDVSLHRSKMV